MFGEYIKQINTKTMYINKTVIQIKYYINAKSHADSNNWCTDYKHKTERHITWAASQTTTVRSLLTQFHDSVIDCKFMWI